MTNDRIIFHIDVNSAYLSWEAVYRLQQGEKIDLRKIPSVVGGNPETRHGIILAKSIPAKKYKIQTGETLHNALQKCPNLTIVSPSYGLYMKCSNAMVEILKEYTPNIQRFSVDECFLDFSNMENLHGDPVELAHKIKDRIHKELGFTVNVGISNNKLLAKMASDLKKPDMVHTLFPHEIKEKMWPLDIRDLFMVGASTERKLRAIGINKIGDLAQADYNLIKYRLKSHGDMIWKYANGIEDSTVRVANYMVMKGLGNSTTISFDVTDRKTAHLILLSLVEMTAMRLRDSENMCTVVAVKIKSHEFERRSHQRKLYAATDCTNEIYKIVTSLFNEAWDGETPIRHLGIRFSGLVPNESYQTSLFDDRNKEKLRILDSTIDDIRMKFGSKLITRASFINSGIRGMTGGVAEDYPLMTSVL